MIFAFVIFFLALMSAHIGREEYTAGKRGSAIIWFAIAVVLLALCVGYAIFHGVVG